MFWQVMLDFTEFYAWAHRGLKRIRIGTYTKLSINHRRIYELLILLVFLNLNFLKYIKCNQKLKIID